MKITRTSILSASSLLIGGLIGASALVAMAQTSNWSGPTATPPNDNVAAPINVGDLAQVKTGLLGLNALQFQPGGTNVATGSVLVAEDQYGTVGWGSAGVSGTYIVQPTWDNIINIKCPVNGRFTNTGTDANTHDFSWLCTNGYVTAVASRASVSATNTTLPAKCSDGNFYLDTGSGSTYYFATVHCDSATGYVTAICDNASGGNPGTGTNDCASQDTSPTYTPGHGIYCNWDGVASFSGSNNSDTSIQCAGNHVYSMAQKGQTLPTYVQSYKLIAQ
jgi:hypothetical protein